MAVRVILMLSLVLSMSPAAKAQAKPTTSAPSHVMRLAGKSLIHQARSLGHLPGGDARLKAARMGILLNRARLYIPNDPQLNRQLGNFHEGVGDLTQAAQAAQRYVAACPHDYPAAVRWMRLAESSLQKAEQRIDFLKDIAADKKLDPGIRATALAMVASINQRQGDRRGAADTAREALVLDEYETLALDVLGRARINAKPLDSLRHALRVLAGDPRHMENAWLVAELLQGAGNYEQALVFYEHAHAVAKSKRPPGSVMEAMLVAYLNALLDAGRADKAVAIFKPLMKGREHSLALQALMVEAFRMLGDADQAAKHVAALAKVYEPLAAAGGGRTGQALADLAWFYLHFQNRPAVALQWAQAAAKSSGDDPQVMRVLGACELARGQTEVGVKRLARAAAKDAHAAAILAQHYYETGRDELAAETLLAGVSETRSLAPWRALAAVAAEHKVTLPARKDASAMLTALVDMPARAMKMGRYSQRFIQVKLAAAADEVAPGEPVAVTVELKNVAKQPVPAGQGGLFAPVVLLGLKVEGDLQGSFPGLTLERLAAPKYLRPGEKVAATVRVDLGAAEKLLVGNPLAKLKLTVSAMLDPLEDRGQLVSAVPEVTIAPVTIQRKALLAPDASAVAVQKALAAIVEDLQQGTPSRQVRAARQTGSLLTLVRRAELGEYKAALPKGLEKPVLQSMVRAHIQSRSSLVRAEMLAVLHHVDLDQRTIGLLSPCVQDRSGLVRMRLIELLAEKRTQGHETLLDFFANDSDGAVAAMARIFREGK